MKLFIVEYCKEGTYDYIAGDEEDMIPLIKETLDKETWQILTTVLFEYWEQRLYDEDITWEKIEEANPGYIEKYDIAFYCETPITKRSEI